MGKTDPAAILSSVIAVYSDQTIAEEAVRQLHDAGIPLEQLSIIGRDVRETETAVESSNRVDYIAAAAETGGFLGFLSGLAAGAGFLFLPQLGPLIVAGPLAAALLGGIEGAAAGAVVGSLAGSLISWNVPQERAITYETHVRAGKYLVIVRSTPEQIARAQKLLATKGAEHVETYVVGSP